MLGLGVGGFVGIKVLTGRPSPTDSDRQVGVEQNGITYSVTVPDGLMQLEPTPDTSVPSELKLEFRLADKPFEGGEIQIGAVAEGLAHRTVEDIAAEAEQSHSHYRNNPEGRVSRAAATVAGRPATAIEVSYQWEGGRYSRQYFIDARPGTPALYLSCDWNDVATVAIDAMCAQMVRSMTIGR
jgi:hypothetical protein